MRGDGPPIPAQPAPGGYPCAVTRSRLAALLALAVLVAACGGTTSTATPGGSTPDASASAVPAGSDAPAGSSGPGASIPAASSTPGQSSAAPGSVPPSASPSDSAVPGGAAACTGSDNNRAFFVNFARSIPWHVFCAVLPKGWFVSSGSNRLAGGGRLVISYKGPDGATVTLSEGSWCTDPNGCVPTGPDSGSAPFGSLSGVVYDLSASGGTGWAVVVDGGQAPSWMLEVHGLDQPSTLALAAALVEVAG
jgi:hypothetical protein